MISSVVAILTFEAEHELTGIDQSSLASTTAMHTIQQ
jgi:hypothetical protein